MYPAIHVAIDVGVKVWWAYDLANGRDKALALQVAVFSRGVALSNVVELALISL